MLLVSCHWSSNEGLWTFYPYGRLFDPPMRCLEFTIGFIHFSYIKKMITHTSRTVGHRKMIDPSFCLENRYFYCKFSFWAISMCLHGPNVVVFGSDFQHFYPFLANYRCKMTMFDSNEWIKSGHFENLQ